MDGLVVNEARLGYDHVTAQEQATANMSLLGGTGNYLDPYYGNKCEMTMVSANSLQISTGAMWINGHNIQITSPITVPIANGQVGVKRKDLICVHLNTSNFGTVNAIDSFDIVAVQGTPSTGTPNDPTLAVDHITHDVQESWSVIGRVTLDGLTPKPELMLSTLPALLITPDRIEPNSIGIDQLEKGLGDSISHAIKKHSSVTISGTTDAELDLPDKSLVLVFARYISGATNIRKPEVYLIATREPSTGGFASEITPLFVQDKRPSDLEVIKNGSNKKLKATFPEATWVNFVSYAIEI